MKREWPELFRISPVTEMEDFMQMQMNMVLPHYDDNGSAVYIFRVRKCLFNCFFFFVKEKNRKKWK